MVANKVPMRRLVGQSSALLVSLHDVSPLTLAACEQAVGLLKEAMFPLESLTVLVIPFHEGQLKIGEHAGTLRFLKQLADLGATLVMHGLTHRMPRHSFNMLGWPMAYGFALGQGEYLFATELEAKTSLAASQTLMAEAGFASAAERFIPPAWLLSDAALIAVKQTDLLFYELLRGIYWRGRVFSQRLIGWGSLTAIESHLTSALALCTSLRSPRDTRLVIHPADMFRQQSRKSLVRVLSRMCDKLVPTNYDNYLSAR